jgi:hypothetical protein
MAANAFEWLLDELTCEVDHRLDARRACRVLLPAPLERAVQLVRQRCDDVQALAAAGTTTRSVVTLGARMIRRW